MSAKRVPNMDSIYEYNRTLKDGSISLRYGYSFMTNGIKFQKVTFSTAKEAEQACLLKKRKIKNLIKRKKPILPDPPERDRILKRLHELLAKKNWTLLSEYKNKTENLRLKCLNCGHEFPKTLGNLKEKSQCPNCRKLRYEENARTKLKELGFELVSEYVDIRKLATLKCLKCGDTFKRTLKSHWKNPTHKCGRNLDWSEIDLNQLKKDFLNGHLSIEKLSPKYGIGHNTLRQKIKELGWDRPPLPKPTGEDHWRYKGVYDKGSSLYETYGHKLKQLGEEVRPDPDDYSLLNVRCFYNGCRKWFRPIFTAVVSRIAALEGRAKWGQNNLYCSDRCKDRCTIYGKGLHQCTVCNKWFVGEGAFRYCEKCSTTRKTFSPSIKNAIYERDLKLGWISESKEYEIHHILNVADFPEYAKKKWNGWAIENQSELHVIIHNVCGLAKRDFYCVDERYFELAISKLKENNAPKKVIEFCIKIYESR
ncbi:MAG: hypothetical protein JSV31_29215 [Desulfobacterales bacterium]|nr:MAG: hypothetical protein JSV31_29215 [Desulfobacterales bacterium]